MSEPNNVTLEQVRKEFENYVEVMKNNRENRLRVFNEIKSELEKLEKKCSETLDPSHDLFPKSTPNSSDPLLFLSSPSSSSSSTPKPSTGLFSSYKSLCSLFENTAQNATAYSFLNQPNKTVCKKKKTMSKKIRQGEECLLAIIGDTDTVTGFMLAGIGDIDHKNNSNFLMVDSKTSHQQIEDAFKRFTTRKDIAILLVTQHIANQIRYLLDQYDQVVPAILEIPSKDSPYDASKDYILARVKQFIQ